MSLRQKEDKDKDKVKIAQMLKRAQEKIVEPLDLSTTEDLDSVNEYANEKNWDYDGYGNWGNFLGSDIEKYGGTAEDVAQYALRDIKKIIDINEIMGK